MYKKILKADYKFDPPFWNNISENAKVFHFPFDGTFSMRVYLLAGLPIVVQRSQFNSWLYLNTVVVRYRSLTD